jgi:[ribosomal protein S18]-alanine N-acetyltransferase
VLSDCSALADLHKANFAHSWSKSDITALISDAHVITLTAHLKKPVGFLMMRQAGGEAEILTIAVDKKHQGKGIATKLLKDIWGKLALQKVEEVFLEVAESNESALHLYYKLGFKQVGTRKSYYGVGQNALILKRALK